MVLTSRLHMKNSIKLKVLGLILISGLFVGFGLIKSQVLFEEDSKGWITYGDATWEFDKGELVGKVTNGSGAIMTKDSFKNFVLELEFKPDSSINSGVFIRCKEYDINFTDCYEINIWDLHPSQENRTGAVVKRFVPLAHVETLNKWNSYKIKMVNSHLEVWVNNILTADYENSQLVEGYIGLQARETGEIRFRNVGITVLD